MFHQSAATSPTQPAADNQPADRLRWRIVQWAVVLHVVLFFHGCNSRNTMLLSVGPVPVVLVDYDHTGPITFQLVDFWPLNLLVVALVCSWLLFRAPRLPQPLLAGIQSRSLFAVVLLTALIFNSFLLIAEVWMRLVAWPILWLLEVGRWLAGLPEGPRSQVAIAATSRLYFGLLAGGLWGTALAARAAARRYLFLGPDRWWQFHLGGLLFLMLLAGTGAGLLLRWLAG